jgi:hypothetical protein
MKEALIVITILCILSAGFFLHLLLRPPSTPAQKINEVVPIIQLETEYVRETLLTSSPLLHSDRAESNA